MFSSILSELGSFSHQFRDSQNHKNLKNKKRENKKWELGFNSNSISISIGYIDDITGPQTYYYGNEIVIVYEKYQCPKYCEVNHSHYVYYNSLTNGMVIDKNHLGEKFKTKKNHKKK